ncbi:MAG: branched-chain amino acid ABC transporter permease [Gaiellaceae bacterium]
MSVATPWILRALVLALLAAAPFAISDFRLFLLTEILIFGLVAASLGLLVGFTGLLSLGHAAYYGVGGYTAALVAMRVTENGPAALALAVLATALVAAGTGWLAVRTRGVFFLMLTLAFAQLLFVLALTWEPVTGGSNGLSGIPRTGLVPGDEGDTLASETNFYYYVLVAFLLGYVLLRRVGTSPFGRALVGIRENEARMRAVGYPVVRYKLASFCIAGAVAGYAGALFVQNTRFISPSNVSFEVSAFALIAVILGGVGTLYGPVLGAALVILLREELSSGFQEDWRLALGVIFVLFVYLVPRGFAGVPATIRKTFEVSPLGRRLGWTERVGS